VRIYQDAKGGWILFDGETKHRFNTESEAENMATKLTLAGQAQASATTMAQIGEDLASLVDVYFDRGYDSGGSNPIIDDDLASLGITAAQLAALITLAQQLANFLGNSAVATADYGATLNASRTDI
jgi:hypothetical protein